MTKSSPWSIPVHAVGPDQKPDENFDPQNVSISDLEMEGAKSLLAFHLQCNGHTLREVYDALSSMAANYVSAAAHILNRCEPDNEDCPYCRVIRRVFTAGHAAAGMAPDDHDKGKPN
jgi:hypothetical protein